MAKILTSVALTLFMFVLPLWGRFDLLCCPQIIFFSLGSMWSLLTQPAINFRKIQSQKDQDHYTAAWIILVIACSQSIAVIEWANLQNEHYFQWNFSGICGMLCILLGGGLRYWAIRSLGDFFTASVAVTDAQIIIKNGPYRYLRHPSYTGGILTVVGTPLVLGDQYAIFITLILMLGVYVYRIKIEEQAMHKTFGEAYKAYQKNTSRLIPFVW